MTFLLSFTIAKPPEANVKEDVAILLIIGVIYLFGFDEWDSFTYLLEHNSNNVVLLLFCLFSALMYLRSEYMEVYLERKIGNY